MKKITPLMIFGVLWLAVIMVSWNTIPGWKDMQGGLWILVGAAAIGVVAFLKDSLSLVKTWIETQSIAEDQPVNPVQNEEKDSRITNIKWAARDPELAKKYFELCAKYDEKFNQYAKEEKQIEFCISYGLVQKVGGQLFLTQAGTLLFCKQELFPHAILHTDVILRNEEHGQEMEQKKDFSGAILDTYFQIYEVLKPLTAEWKSTNIRNQSGQEELFFYYPDIAMTEILVNFFIHRDYSQDDMGFITIYSDRIEFINPGISTFTAEELLNVNLPLRPPYQRNPRLLQALRKTGLNQSEGRGILRTKEALIKNKSVDPQGKVGLFIENDEKAKRFRMVLFKKIPAPLKQKQVDAKPRILIVEDDLDVAEMLNAYFRVQGYDVFTVNWGRDGIKSSQSQHPDLIILDIRLPDIDGYEVARQIRGNRSTQEVPIIFLTEKRDRSDRLHGFVVGGDDYITKPFDVQELRLRVRNALKRASMDSLANSITGLPDGVLVEERLLQAIQENGYAALCISILKLDKFRDAYGFIAADDVLRAISLMVQNTLRDSGTPEDFLGHLSPSDFVIITTPMNVTTLHEKLYSRISQALDYFYPTKDREQVSKLPDRLAINISEVESLNKYSNIELFKDALLRNK